MLTSKGHIMKKFTIKMDSEKPFGTVVLTPEGEDISRHVMRVVIEHRAGSLPVATIELLSEMDVLLGPDVVEGIPRDAGSAI